MYEGFVWAMWTNRCLLYCGLTGEEVTFTALSNAWNVTIPETYVYFVCRKVLLLLTTTTEHI